MELELNILKRIVCDIVSSHPDEMNCWDCFEHLDLYVEIALAGKDAGAAMPLVQQHLEQCSDCEQEFQALWAALRAIDAAP
jgi:hypothetical protein